MDKWQIGLQKWLDMINIVPWVVAILKNEYKLREYNPKEKLG